MIWRKFHMCDKCMRQNHVQIIHRDIMTTKAVTNRWLVIALTHAKSEALLLIDFNILKFGLK